MRSFILSAFLFGTLCMNANANSYPPHWWGPIHDPNKPEWEVLPQEAGEGEVILSKRNELGALSNFSATPFVFRGKRFASLEGFWQSMLYPEDQNDPRVQCTECEWKYSRTEVEKMTAFEAKTAGDLAFQNMKIMGIDWISFEGKRFIYWTSEKGEHYQLVVAASWQKVLQNPNIRDVLMRTGNLILRPDHHQPVDAPPSWKYFQIYMEIREAIRQNEIPKGE